MLAQDAGRVHDWHIYYQRKTANGIVKTSFNFISKMYLNFGRVFYKYPNHWGKKHICDQVLILNLSGFLYVYPFILSCIQER
jgi:hypothetical protein